MNEPVALEMNIGPLVEKELAKMTVRLKITGVKYWSLRLWIASVVLRAGALIAGMTFRKEHVEIEVS